MAPTATTPVVSNHRGGTCAQQTREHHRALVSSPPKPDRTKSNTRNPYSRPADKKA